MPQNTSLLASSNLPPRAAATDDDQLVRSAATAVAATSSDIWAPYVADAGGLKTPQGKIWLELEVTGFDAYVRFNRTATTATTISNGSVLRVGIPRVFYVDPTKDLFLDHISPGGVGVIKWRKVSPIGERTRT